MRQSFFWGSQHIVGDKHFQYWCVASANQRGAGEGVWIPNESLRWLLRESSVVRAVRVASPSVVAITTEVATQNPFSWMGSGTASSEGSGVVIDSQGIMSHECTCGRGRHWD